MSCRQRVVGGCHKWAQSGVKRIYGGDRPAHEANKLVQGIYKLALVGDKLERVGDKLVLGVERLIRKIGRLV